MINENWIFFVTVTIGMAAIYRILSKILENSRQISIRVELIHEYILYGKKEIHPPVKIEPIETPTLRSESAKKMWATRRAKQLAQKATSDKQP